MPQRFSAARVWAAIEDWLIPTLRLSSHERSLYYHLVRRSRLAGRRFFSISRRQAARVSGLSTYTARHYLRVLVRKQCVRILDRGWRGCRLEVFLPDEIAARSVGAPVPEQLALVPHQSDRDAAGQPRAWPRSDHFRNDDFRARILLRDRGRCFYCRRTLRPRDWSLDHVLPIARGGSDSPSNLVACCHACNSAKADMSAQDFLKSLARKKVLTQAQLSTRMKCLRSFRTLTPGP